MALLMVDLVKEHGLQYLLAATFLDWCFAGDFWGAQTGPSNEICTPSCDDWLHQRSSSIALFSAATSAN